MVGYVIAFAVGWLWGSRQRIDAQLPAVSATEVVAKALAGNTEALRWIADTRAKAARGDLEAKGHVADIDNAITIAELARAAQLGSGEEQPRRRRRRAREDEPEREPEAAPEPTEDA